MIILLVNFLGDALIVQGLTVCSNRLITCHSRNHAVMIFFGEKSNQRLSLSALWFQISLILKTSACLAL